MEKYWLITYCFNGMMNFSTVVTTVEPGRFFCMMKQDYRGQERRPVIVTAIETTKEAYDEFQRLEEGGK